MPDCPNCGASVRVEATYCEGCGASVVGGGDAETSIRQDGQGDDPVGEPTQPIMEAENDPQQHGPAEQDGQPRADREPADTTSSASAGDGSDDGISRRKLLLGGAGATAVAGLGGWYFFLRGPTGAKAVVANYVNAVADNDWERAGDLFHASSNVRQTIQGKSDIEGYEDYLGQHSRTLEVLRELEPKILRHLMWAHYPDYDEEAAEALDLYLDIPPDAVDEVKRISTLVEVDVSALYDEEKAQHLAGDTTKEGFSATVVSDGSEWSLWQIYQPR